MNTRCSSLRHWLPGSAVAWAGAVIVRWVAPCFADRTQALVLLAGYLLVPIGLGWLAVGLSRRAAQRAEAAAELPAD